MTEYKCPYCGQDSYAKTSKKSGKFADWDSVRKHTSKCINNNNDFFIHLIYGPIHHNELNELSNRELKDKYPGILFSQYSKHFRDKNKNIRIFNSVTKKQIIEAIQDYEKVYGKIPSSREFSLIRKYPSLTSLYRLFGSFNSALEAAGLTPNIQNGFGIDTYGLDGHLYRSKAEAYFADNYLHNKYVYEIEPRYPNNLWRYDWYIKEINLYIELDGGLRPECIQEKIELNKKLNRNLRVITIDELYAKNFNI